MGFFREWGSARNMFAYTNYAAIRKAAEEGFEEGYETAQEISDHDHWDDTPEAESPFLNQQYLRSLDQKMNQIRGDFPKIKIELAKDGWLSEEIIEKYMFLDLTPETLNTYNTIKKKGESYYDLICDLDFNNEILLLDPKIEGDAFIWDGGKGNPSDAHYFSHMVINNGRIRRTGKHLGVKVKVDWLSDGRCVVSLIEVLGPVQKQDELFADTRFRNKVKSLKLIGDSFIWEDGKREPNSPGSPKLEALNRERVRQTGLQLGVNLSTQWLDNGQCLVSIYGWKHKSD
jgi:hypothetical protein